MKLDGLRSLNDSMKRGNIDRYHFEYRHSRAVFDVFFFIDEEPFILLFGAKGHAFSFELKVWRGFEIDPLLPYANYLRLCEILNLRYDPANRFSPRGFFEQFNREIPKVAKVNSHARPQDIAKYRRCVEEEDKIYFLSWRNNNARDERVSEANLRKTKDLLGTKAYDICFAKNISSCWTDDPAFAKTAQLPD